MKYQFEDRGTSGLFLICKGEQSLKGEGIREGGTINTIVWNRKGNQQVTIDGVSYTFPANSVLPLVANQHFRFERPEELLAWQFNREFYCIADHDAEVSCVGFLFFGIHHPLFIQLGQAELDQMDIIDKMSIAEICIRDRMQGEMLRLLLKKVIISLTRLARKQTESTQSITDEKLDLIRMFNVLLEQHFRQQHEVAFYAGKLNRSPKTLSNVFATNKHPSPSALIHQRIIQEAKRYLFYTDKTAKEIAYLLGFENPAHFSRYFKNHTGKNISIYKTDVP